mmetsp:Transcript_24464/g.48728  ORF Transcript_24464/g.48728 Transcript_24464/m.48728 type:complete len:219 (+) Transcript_24464:29-685(+)
MKSFAIILAVVGASSVSAFQAISATAAVKKKTAVKKVVRKVAPKKAVVKKVAPKRGTAKVAPKKVAPKKKVAGKKGPPESKSYPMLNLKVQFKNVSGGGNKGPNGGFSVPDFSDPKLQITRDPAFYAAAAKTRGADNNVFDYDDGLTLLERNQRKNSQKTFLTGGARSQIDASAIRDDIDQSVVDSFFGLDADRFQLLFISIFGVFTLVGSLSGNLKL